MALMCTIPSTTSNNVRRFSLRGVPDDQITDGEYVPTPGYTTAVAFFAQELGNWQFLGQDLTIPPLAVTTIDAVGNVVMAGAPGYLVGDTVAFSKVKRNTTGELISFRSVVISVGPNPNQFQVLGGILLGGTGGTARKITYALFTMNPAQFNVDRAAVRKVGRPFGQYRGRRSRRKAVV
jgi:hypothetical protein